MLASVLQVWRCPRRWSHVHRRFTDAGLDGSESETSRGTCTPTQPPPRVHPGSTLGVETSPTMTGHGYGRIARRDPVWDDRVRSGAAVDASGGWVIAGGARGTGRAQ